jgi:hypothetical protein
MPVGAVYTIALIAKTLGEDEDLLLEISGDMTAKDGCVNVHDVDGNLIVAFTNRGVGKLRELLPLYKTRGAN